MAGFADHCAGPVEASYWPVTVRASEHGRVVATKVVSYDKDRNRYQFSLPPGRYVISALGSADAPQAVVVRPGQRAIANFPNTCY